MTWSKRSIEVREELASRFAHLSRYPGQFDRAIEAVLGGCLKRHVFTPSGRILYTVVGKSGEEFIDPDRPFCSCKQFFFRVLGGKVDTCYHLLGYKIAKEGQLFDEIRFGDEEFEAFLRLLIVDLLEDKEDKDS